MIEIPVKKLTFFFLYPFIVAFSVEAEFATEGLFWQQVQGQLLSQLWQGS